MVKGTSILKRICCFALSLLCITLVSCHNTDKKEQASSDHKSQSQESETDESEVPEEMLEQRSILSDPAYQNGFMIFGLSPEKDGVNPKGYFPEGSDQKGRVHWQLCQWYGRYSLADPQYAKQTVLSPGVNQIKTPSLKFICDSNQNLLTFHAETSKVYDQPRKTGDQGWTHLLISQNFSNEDNWNKASEMEKFIVSMDTKLTKFEDHMGDAFNKDIHAAQFLMFIVTANMNPDSADYGKYIWFGIGMFDNRQEFSQGGAMWDKGTQAMMYGLSTKDTLVGDYHYFKDDKVQAGPDTPWVSYRVDVLKHLEAALTVTQYQGYLLDTTVEDLSFNGFNLGWEIPGTYDVEMLLKDFKMTVMRKKS